MRNFESMFKNLTKIWIGFTIALRELWRNKLRTFLSLFGITIGIFCIIGVLSVVDSLENKVQSDIKSFGEKTIYIDKWVYDGDEDYPWWKYINRPTPSLNDFYLLKKKSNLITNLAFFASQSSTVNFKNNKFKNVNTYGISEEFNQIQKIDIDLGSYFTENNFKYGANVCIIGHDLAVDLFESAQNGIHKYITLDNKKLFIIGIIKKVGTSFVGGFDYDKSLLLPLEYFQKLTNVKDGNPFIMASTKANVSSTLFKSELIGVMRQIRRLKPVQEDNFTCNDVQDFSKSVSGFFGKVNVGGWAIAGLSLLVGVFGVANIMFVTVRERRSQIGLKKSLGASKRIILFEFLVESAFLCLIGGLIGIFLVWCLTMLLNSFLPFHIFVDISKIILAVTICFVLGMISGFVPALKAANLDPVVAIRST